jgi:hypothetical protein
MAATVQARAKSRFRNRFATTWELVPLNDGLIDPAGSGAAQQTAIRAQVPEGAVQHASVIDARHASRLVCSRGSITPHSKSVRSYRFMWSLKLTPCESRQSANDHLRLYKTRRLSPRAVIPKPLVGR